MTRFLLRATWIHIERRLLLIDPNFFLVAEHRRVVRHRPRANTKNGESQETRVAIQWKHRVHGRKKYRSWIRGSKTTREMSSHSLFAPLFLSFPWFPHENVRNTINVAALTNGTGKTIVAKSNLSPMCVNCICRDMFFLAFRAVCPNSFNFLPWDRPCARPSFTRIEN